MPPKPLPRRLDNPLIKPYKPKTVPKSSPARDTPIFTPSGPLVPTTLPDDQRRPDISVVRAALPLERPQHLPQPPIFEAAPLVVVVSQTQQQSESVDVAMADQHSGGGEASAGASKPDVVMSGMPRASDEVLATRPMKARKDMRVPTLMTPIAKERDEFEEIAKQQADHIKSMEKRQEKDEDTIHKLEDEILKVSSKAEGMSKVMSQMTHRLKGSQAQLAIAHLTLEQKEEQLLREKERNDALGQLVQAEKQRNNSFQEEVANMGKGNEGLQEELNKVFTKLKNTTIDLQTERREKFELEHDMKALQYIQTAWQARGDEILELQSEVERSMSMLGDAEDQREVLKQEHEHFKHDNTRLQRENAELNEQLQRAIRNLQENTAQADLLSPTRMLSPIRHIPHIHRSMDEELNGSNFDSPTTERFYIGCEPGVDVGTMTDDVPTYTAAQQTQPVQPAQLGFSDIASVETGPISPQVIQMSHGATQTDTPDVKQMSHGATQTPPLQPVQLSYSVIESIAVEPIAPAANQMSHGATQTDTPDVKQMSHGATQTDTPDAITTTKQTKPVKLGYATIKSTEVVPVTPELTTQPQIVDTTNANTQSSNTSRFGKIHIHLPEIDIRLPRLSAIAQFLLLLLFYIFFSYAVDYLKLSDKRHDWVKGNEYTRESVMNLRYRSVQKYTGRDCGPGLEGWIGWLLLHIPFGFSVFYDPRYLSMMVDLSESSGYGTRFLA